MKKLSLLSGMAMLATVTFAQTEKGRILWTGSAATSFIIPDVDISAGSNQTTSLQSIDFNRGVFVRDNWLVGVGVSGSLSQSRSKSSNDNSILRSFTTNAGINGFVRRYWGRDKWRVFLGGGIAGDVQILASKYETVYPNSKMRNTILSLRPFTNLGAYYFVNDRLGLEVSSSSNSFPFSINTLSVGLVVLNSTSKWTDSEVIEAPQTAKGRWILSGGFTTNNISTVYSAFDSRANIVSFSLSPSLGLFVQKNTLLGISIPFSYLRAKTVNSALTDVASYVQIGINPYVKRYISDNRLRPFVGGDLSFYQARLNSRAPLKTQIVAGNLNTGLAYMLGERFIVEATLASLNINRPLGKSEEGQSRSWSVNLSGTLRPGFNLVYVFR